MLSAANSIEAAVSDLVGGNFNCPSISCGAFKTEALLES